MPRKKIDSTTSDSGNNPELAKTTEGFKQEMLAEITKKYGVFDYKTENGNTNEMPSAVKNGVFTEYPKGSFLSFIENPKAETSSDGDQPKKIEEEEEKDDEPLYDPRTFHNRNHTEKVMNRIEALCKAINNHAITSGHPEIAISPDIINILILAAAAHDLDQSSHTDKTEGKRVADLRFYESRDNEKRSALTAVKGTEEKIRSIIHDPKEADRLLLIIDTAIVETGPHIHFAKGTVQQQFDSSKPWEAHLLAYVDIGAAGMSPKTFITEGDAFLLELHPFVLKAFGEYYEGKEIDAITRKEVEEKVKGWDLDQINWVKDREAKFNGPWTDNEMVPPQEFPADIDLVPPEVRKALLPLFSNFAESARLAEDRQKKRANMTFEQLAENFGFKRH